MKVIKQFISIKYVIQRDFVYLTASWIPHSSLQYFEPERAALVQPGP